VAMGSCGAVLVVGVGVRLWRRAVPALPTTTSAGNDPHQQQSVPAITRGAGHCSPLLVNDAMG